MAKKYVFDLDVESNALLQANAQEFYSKALLAQRSTTYMRPLVNVKEKIKVGSFEFDDPIQEADCDFLGTDSTLDAKSMEPCKLAIGTDICQYDLESSFIVLWMAQGSNKSDFIPANFMAHAYERLAAAVSHSLELITWRGDITGATGTSLDYCDGLEKKLAFADIPGAQRITGTSITSSNVITELTKVYNAIPVAIRAKKAEVVWYVSANIAAAYKLAVAVASAEVYTRQDPELSFLGYKLVEANGASDNVMALSLGMNFIFMTDLMSDSTDFISIDMKRTTGDRKVRILSDFKFGVDFVNEDEFVVYGIAKQS